MYLRFLMFLVISNFFYKIVSTFDCSYLQDAIITLWYIDHLMFIAQYLQIPFYIIFFKPRSYYLYLFFYFFLAQLFGITYDQLLTFKAYVQRATRKALKIIAFVVKFFLFHQCVLSLFCSINYKVCTHYYLGSSHGK